MVKDYLNASETDQLLLFGFTTDYAEEIKGWDKRNNLTKEEKTALKFAHTYAEKFYKMVLDRLDPKEAVKFIKRIPKYKLLVVNEFEKKRLIKQQEKIMENVVIDRPDFEDWTEEVMAAPGNCLGCSKHHSSCKLHSLFLKYNIPESNWNLENCRYAYREIIIKPKK